MINLCEDKILIPENKQVKVQSIAPNPVNESFNLTLVSEITGLATIEIYDNMGVLISKVENVQITVGSNLVTVNSSYLNSGNYKGIIKINNAVVVFAFIVVK